MSPGTRRLIILGCSVTLFALLTTSVSLIIYHNSGDIYLDRSRPGYLPDEDEAKDIPADEKFTFEKTGPVTTEVLDDYITHYESELRQLDNYPNAFATDKLSDAALGITSKD